jgi:undecaprenyl-diphosphatase
MSPFQAAVLGAVQGLTESLPISSSAHLYVIPTLLGWPYAGVAFDVALHWGTLIALLVAFWKDWLTLARDALGAPGPERDAARGTWIRLAVATVPAAIAGLLLEDLADTALRALPIQAATLAVFGFLLWWVDRVRPVGREARDPGWATCLIMGTAQALALVPGVSRSGVTITAGRACGLARVSAARFSFLLATPITFGAGLLKMKDLSPDLPASTLAIGVVSAAVTGFLAIRGLIQWLGRGGFAVFFVYRLLLAAVILLSLGRG